MATIHPDIVNPLTWSALWDSIGDEYHNATVEQREPRLIPTTAEMAEEMLCAVPPRLQTSAGFLVGEANHHNNAGRAVYAGFVRLGSAWFARYATADEFRTL
jgi:hypothetical protein